MFHFIYSESRQPADQLNEFLGAPFETTAEAIDLIRRMPDWRQLQAPNGEDTALFANSRTGLGVQLTEMDGDALADAADDGFDQD